MFLSRDVRNPFLTENGGFEDEPTLQNENGFALLFFVFAFFVILAGPGIYRYVFPVR